MNWFRMDKGISRHPKLLALTPAQRWTWLDALCWAVEYSEDHGHLPDVADQAVPGLAKLRARLRELELLDAGDTIHDWLLYTASSIEAKVRWYLDRYPDASANEVARQVRGNRQLVLGLVHEYRHTGSTNGTSEPPKTVPKPVSAGARHGTSQNERTTSSVVESVERLPADDDDKNDNEEEPDSLGPEVAALMPNLKEL